MVAARATLPRREKDDLMKAQLQGQTKADDDRSLGLRRIDAMMRKEYVMLARDRVTLASMALIPLVLILLHGYAMDNTPHDLPTAWISPEESDVTLELRTDLERTGFFRVMHYARTTDQADHWLKSGEVTFVVEVPSGFERRLRRGEYPAILVSADATDPVAMAIALGSLDGVKATVLNRLRGLSIADGENTGFELRVHRRYNPAGSTTLNVVPGLLGIILNICMLFFTALSVTREIEQGTMEGLLAMPITPAQIMIGQLMPYVLVGAAQAFLIVIISIYVFHVPMVGSFILLSITTTLFIITNLAIGYTFSTVSQNQLQAVQLAIMFFLPSILISGILSPFAGMPRWAQYISECLPLTHFARIVRGIMLKGSDWFDVASDTSALVAIMIISMVVAMMRYKTTLD
jgi:ABC-2 type transport system permease protein